MLSIGLLGLTSLILCLVLTPLCRDIFLCRRLLDVPDVFRKRHARAVPRVGGVAIALSYILAFALLLPAGSLSDRLIGEHFPLILKISGAASIVFATGLIDDLRGLRPWQKLTGQLAGALCVVFAGVQVQGFGGSALSAWWTLPVTIAWLLLCTNAFNLIDGLDGLAAGVGLLAACTALIAGLTQHNFALPIATAPLVGCLLGFLRYNFSPASIFMGDCGSLLIGFLLGCFGIIWSQKTATILGMTAPMVAFAVPLVDTGIAIARRFLRSRPIFGADRAHIHHRLLDRGFTPRRVTLLLYCACAVAASFSLLQSVADGRYAGTVVVIFCAAVTVGVQSLRYEEFEVARRMLQQRAFGRLLDAEILSASLGRDLARCVSLDQCWDTLTDLAPQFGISAVRLVVQGAVFETPSAPLSPDTAWSLSASLSDSVRIDVRRDVASSAHPLIACMFLECVRTSLGAHVRNLAVRSQAAGGGAERLVSSARSVGSPLGSAAASSL